MEKEWKNGGVSGVEESTECRRDWTCLLRQFIAIPRHRLRLGGCLGAMTSGERISWRVGYGKGERPIRWLSTEIVQGSVIKDPNLL